MKKICYIINSDWYFDLHWLERAKATQNEGYEVHVLANFDSLSVKERLINIGFFCHDAELNAQSINPFSFIYTFFHISKVLNRIDADIIHCITIKPSILGGLYSRIYKKKVVISFVGLGRVFSDDGYLNVSLKIIVLPLFNFIFKNDNVFLIFEHEGDRKKLSSLTGLSLSKTCIIDGAGVDTNLFYFQDELPCEVPVILFASRLLKRKGLQDLIFAKNELRKQHVFFDINAAGITVKDDPDALELEQIEKWHNSGLINWLGHRKDIDRLIAQAHLVALPSTYPEGVPRILIEGASIGRPLISYDSGGCNSIIHDGINGFLVKKGDLAELSKKIKILVENTSLRKEMGINSRNLVMRKFSSEMVVSKTLEIYRTLLNC